MTGYSPDSLSSVVFGDRQFNAAVEQMVVAAGGKLTLTPTQYPELKELSRRMAVAVSRAVDGVVSDAIARGARKESNGLELRMP